jgi:tetratricopeptide (TPR) repeat protein
VTGAGLALDNLGFVAQLQGNYEGATRYLEESLALAQAIGNRQGEANTLLNLGHVATAQERREEAAVFYQQALKLARELEVVPVMLEILAGLAWIQPEPQTTLAWFGLVLNHPATTEETRNMVKPLLEKLNLSYPPHMVESGLAHGQTLDLMSVVDQILSQTAVENEA